MYSYELETKAQSSQKKFSNEPRPKKARQVPSNVKVLLIVFFDYHGIVYHEFLPHGVTVSNEYYFCLLRRLCQTIRTAIKQPDLWKDNSWKLHHDSAPAHIPLVVQDFL